MPHPPRCYVVDDEELALASMLRLLRETGRVEIAGHTTDPAAAIEEIRFLAPDVLFLDIHMPEIDGFQLLAVLPQPPQVVFTTAYDHHAVRAFEVNSVDYLLKPVSRERLNEALDRLAARTQFPPIAELLRSLAPPKYLRRVSTTRGEHITLIDVAEVTHFMAKDRYTFACTGRGEFLIDLTLAELESRLDPTEFLRVHRSSIVNLRFVERVSRWLAGRLLVRLKDRAGTEITVSRDKAALLRQALDLE